MQIAVLGRQPHISLAELESIYGAKSINLVSESIALINTPLPLEQKRLGGTIKSAKVLTKLDKTTLNEAFLYLQKTIPAHLKYLPEGKLQFGVSIYGYKAQKNWLLKQLLILKKVIKSNGQSVRVIENKSQALDAAQVIYNKLTGVLGWELLIIKDGADVIIAQTTGVQNVDDYSKRDFNRPKRDARVGMLPPKLAQIMINLAVGKTVPKYGSVILDPFCGTGVVLQEAALLGFDIYGTDINPRMIEYTDENLIWLNKTNQLSSILAESKTLKYFKTEVADATSHIWKPSPNFIVSETFLGKPLTSLPSEEALRKIIAESNTIAEGFFKNIAKQIKPGVRLCIALPAWIKNSEFIKLKVLDHLTDMGYNRIDLKYASKEDLIYHRPNQFVARQLVILEKK